jgi:transposase
VTRPSRRFVPVKTVEQQDILALHRVRAQLIKKRTALANEMRGLLAGRGIVVGKGLSRLCHALALIVEDQDGRLGGLMRELIAEMGERLRLSDERTCEASSERPYPVDDNAPQFSGLRILAVS